MSSQLTRRLDRLHEYIIDGEENCAVKIIYKDGSTISVPFCDFSGGFDANGELVENAIELAGWRGEIASLSCDNWRYANMIALTASLWGATFDAQR